MWIFLIEWRYRFSKENRVLGCPVKSRSKINSVFCKHNGCDKHTRDTFTSIIQHYIIRNKSTRFRLDRNFGLTLIETLLRLKINKKLDWNSCRACVVIAYLRASQRLKKRIAVWRPISRVCLPWVLATAASEKKEKCVIIKRLAGRAALNINRPPVDRKSSELAETSRIFSAW